VITIPAEMELRNHAVMACDGVKIWPPKWLQTYGSGIGFESGEVGVLDGVHIPTGHQQCLFDHAYSRGTLYGHIDV
jgi:hypothetical protein